MLSFVGLGLYDERSITLDGRDVVRAADRVFAEQYTSQLAGTSIEELEAFHVTEITVRERAGIESNPALVLEAAAAGEAVLLIAGDPMIATTHVDLRLRAHDRGIATQIVHGTTAQAAASGLTGLQNYRFGKATTLPFPDAHGSDSVPASVLDTIAANQERDLHTLVYLDIKAPADEFLTANQAAELLAVEYGDALGIGVAQAGSPEPVVKADRLTELATYEFGPPLHLLVLPGNLHPLEADALAAFADAPPDLLSSRAD